MPGFTRGTLIKTLKTFAANAIERDEQPFGRQLATVCEHVALTLRAKFGGKAAWELRPASSNGAKPVSKPVAAFDPGPPVWVPDCRTEQLREAMRLVTSARDPSSAFQAVVALGVSRDDTSEIVRLVIKARGADPPFARSPDGSIVLPAWPADHLNYVPVDNLQTGVQS